MAELTVIPSTVDGWDVIRGDQAVSNHADKETALAAARLRAAEEEQPTDVVVDEQHSRGIDDSTRGVKTYFVALVGLLLATTAIIAITALLASATGI